MNKQRFISRMLFGIQASRDVNHELDSGIARSLNEEIRLYKIPEENPAQQFFKFAL